MTTKITSVTGIIPGKLPAKIGRFNLEDRVPIAIQLHQTIPGDNAMDSKDLRKTKLGPLSILNTTVRQATVKPVFLIDTSRKAEGCDDSNGIVELAIEKSCEALGLGKDDTFILAPFSTTSNGTTIEAKISELSEALAEFEYDGDFSFEAATRTAAENIIKNHGNEHRLQINMLTTGSHKISDSQISDFREQVGNHVAGGNIIGVGSYSVNDAVRLSMGLPNFRFFDLTIGTNADKLAQIIRQDANIFSITPEPVSVQVTSDDPYLFGVSPSLSQADIDGNLLLGPYESAYVIGFLKKNSDGKIANSNLTINSEDREINLTAESDDPNFKTPTGDALGCLLLALAVQEKDADAFRELFKQYPNITSGETHSLEQVINLLKPTHDIPEDIEYKEILHYYMNEFERRYSSNSTYKAEPQRHEVVTISQPEPAPAALTHKDTIYDTHPLRLLPNQVITIGRSSSCSLCLTDPRVSNHHCSIKPEKGAYILLDINSTNGTLVNGKKVTTPTKVKHGDIIKVGNTFFRIEINEQQEAIPIEPASTPKSTGDDPISLKLSPGDPITIGRGTDCDLRLTNKGISRRHCQITYDDTEKCFYITDLSSTNGTFVNSNRIRSKTVLNNGDLINIGDTTLKVEIDPNVEIINRPRIEVKPLQEILIPSETINIHNLTITGPELSMTSHFNSQLAQGKILIGGLQEANREKGIIVFNSEVSQAHAEITITRGKYYIKDLGSSRGTYIIRNVKGRSVMDPVKTTKPTRLLDGDIVEIGGQYGVNLNIKIKKPWWKFW